MPEQVQPPHSEKVWGQPWYMLRAADELANEGDEALPAIVRSALGAALASACSSVAEGQERLDQAMVDSEPKVSWLQERRNKRVRVAVNHLRAAAIRLHHRSLAEERANRRLDEALAAMQSASLSELADSDNGLDIAACYVYCLWGEDPVTPLYVGLSTNVLARLGTHVSDPDKRTHIRWITLTRCRDVKQMRETELRMIRHYRPPWNVVGVPAA